MYIYNTLSTKKESSLKTCSMLSLKPFPISSNFQITTPLPGKTLQSQAYLFSYAIFEQNKNLWFPIHKSGEVDIL